MHAPAGINPDTITCLECHNPHSNRDYTTDGGTSAAGTNIKLIGVQFDPYDRTEYTYATIRERKTTPPLGDVGTANYVAFAASPDDWTRPDGLGVCQGCHTAPHNEGQDCTGCHDHDAGFAGSGSCDACHDINSGHATAPLMFDSTGGNFAGVPYGSHLIASATDDLSTVADWAVQCGKCHGAHNGDFMVPNNADVGITYNSHGGIWLGGTATGGATTEAEICWGCHDNEGVSEWGTNTQTLTGSSSYDYGSVNPGAGVGWYADPTSGSEVGATWTSANFAYKTNPIVSTHSTSGNATTPGIDPVDEIRCSYCHDVHDLNALVSDSSSGKPYLRGSWMGNPYKEDGAPQLGTNYTANTSNDFGPVPRADNSPSMEMGGYWIDQNTDHNAAGNDADNDGYLDWTPSEFAGLCALCHSSNTDGTWNLVDSGSGNDIDNLNKFDLDESGVSETPNISWAGTNGHSNAVLGGTGFNAENIFSQDIRKPLDGFCGPNGLNDADGNANGDDGYCAGYPDMAYQHYSDEGTSTRGFGLRGHIDEGEGFYMVPNVRVNQPYAWNDYMWGADVDNGPIPQNQYHQFSCSKCHNPHASRLPRLLITNCLDIERNTWDDAPVGVRNGTLVQISGSGSGNNGTYTAVGMAMNSAVPVMLFTNGTLNSNESGGFTVTIDPGGSNEVYTEGANNTFEIETAVDIGGTTYDIIYDDLNKNQTLGQYIVGRRTPPKGESNKSGSLIYDDNDDVTLAYATSAQNCHRYEDANGDGDGLDTGEEPGWNSVTPW